MSILVTGSAGFIGSHVVDTLLESGHEVVGFDNFDSFYDVAIKERNLSSARDFDAFSQIRGDIRSAEAVASVPDDVDTIVHLAARAGVRPSIEAPAEYVDVNLNGTARLLELARDRRIDRFVFASSSSVYGENRKVPFSEDDPVDNPISPYAATKRSGELLCHAFHHLEGSSVICLRFFTVYGPRQRPDLAIHKFARLMSQGRPIPVFGDGSSRRDYTYIDDTLSGVSGALRYLDGRPGVFEVVNLGESRTVTLSEMIRVLSEEMGVEPSIDRKPTQPGDVQRTFADVSKAGALFQYLPATEFRDGIRYFLDWFQSAELD